jgi:putative ABC transport system permease protein
MASPILIFVNARFGGGMPLAYTEQIARREGVSKIAFGAGIGGSYQTPEKRIGINMTDARILEGEPRIDVPPEIFAKLESVRNGVIINQTTADRVGWKEGGTYPLETGRQNKEGNRVWTFQVVAVVPDSPDRPGGG